MKIDSRKWQTNDPVWNQIMYRQEAAKWMLAARLKERFYRNCFVAGRQDTGVQHAPLGDYLI